MFLCLWCEKVCSKLARNLKDVMREKIENLPQESVESLYMIENTEIKTNDRFGRKYWQHLKNW